MYEAYKFLNLVFRATIIPGLIIILWLTGLLSVTTFQFSLVFFVIVFIGLPFLFSYSVSLQRNILFLTFIKYPKGLNLNDPASVGLFGTRNFFINVRDSDIDNQRASRIGAWHVLPLYITKRFAKELKLNEKDLETLQNVSVPESKHLQTLEPLIKSEFPEVTPANEQHFYERLLKLPDGNIVLYLHGNTASRGSGHRNEIYKICRTLGYHVFTIDYRSYGDSDPVPPTEEGVVRDALAAYEYISNLTTNPIFIWGHSLGTGVTTRLCAQLIYLKERGPRGVILESPFTNIRDEIRMHPFAKPFKNLPWFEMAIARPMFRNSLRFESDQHISEFRQPVMILHAEDDYVVPFELGYKLYRAALDTRGRSWGPVEFHRFDGSLKYGHKHICRAPELPELVQHFVATYRDEVF